MYHQRFKTTDQRFDEKYEAVASGCWEWKAPSEYPKFRVGNGHIKASRFALQRKLCRALEPHECACHTCDNPRCVNPEHLFVGSHTDNMQDRAAKKRFKGHKGAENGRAKLTAEDVIKLRAMYEAGEASQDRLAALFGVSQTVVSSAIRRQTWTHI